MIELLFFTQTIFDGVHLTLPRLYVRIITKNILFTKLDIIFFIKVTGMSGRLTVTMVFLLQTPGMYLIRIYIKWKYDNTISNSGSKDWYFIIILQQFDVQHHCSLYYSIRNTVNKTYHDENTDFTHL